MYHQQVSGDTEVGEFTDTPEGCTALERDLNRLEKWVILPLLFSTGEVIPAELDAFSTREICMYWRQSKIIKEVEHLKYGESLSKEYSASRREDSGKSHHYVSGSPALEIPKGHLDVGSWLQVALLVHGSWTR